MPKHRKNPRRPLKGGPTFIYAPPDVVTWHFTAKPPKSPYPNAPEWQKSVYYYWWEYLRRHDGYKETCLANGRGAYADLFADFGDVHAVDFQTWFAQNGVRLFAEEQMARAELFKDPDDIARFPQSDFFYVAIPYVRKQRSSLRHVRELLAQHNPTRPIKDRPRRAKFNVTNRPVLSSLHKQLEIYDLYGSGATLVDIAKAVGLYNLDSAFAAAAREDGTIKLSVFKRKYEGRMRSLVSRHYRIACQYVENVALGRFPERSRR